MCLDNNTFGSPLLLAGLCGSCRWATFQGCLFVWFGISRFCDSWSFCWFARLNMWLRQVFISYSYVPLSLCSMGYFQKHSLMSRQWKAPKVWQRAQPSFSQPARLCVTCLSKAVLPSCSVPTPLSKAWGVETMTWKKGLKAVGVARIKAILGKQQVVATLLSFMSLLTTICMSLCIYVCIHFSISVSISVHISNLYIYEIPMRSFFSI